VPSAAAASLGAASAAASLGAASAAASLGAASAAAPLNPFITASGILRGSAIENQL